MLEELYEQGYLNYQALILNNYKKIEINEVDAIILIKILDLYKTTKKIRVNKLSQETGISKKTIEDSLNNLITKNLYGINLVLNDNGLSEEKISLDPLFDKLEGIFKGEEIVKVEEGLKKIVALYEGEIQRPVTPQEYAVLEDFIIKDGFSTEDVEKAIKAIVKMGRVNLSTLEHELFSAKRESLSPKKNVNPDTANALKKIKNLLDE